MMDFYDYLLEESARSAPVIGLTNHARARFAERTGIRSEEGMRAFLDEAALYARNMNCFQGVYRQYLTEKAATSGLWPLVHKGLLLLIDPRTCALVTLYRVPRFFCEEPNRVAPPETVPAKLANAWRRLRRRRRADTP